MSTPILPPRAEMVHAFMGSDPSYEGIFYTAVRTTGIFCRPTCSARKPKPENVDFYASADDAMAAGFRPCKRCRPLDVPAAPDWVQGILDEAERGDGRRWSDETLRARGVDPVRLRRWCKQHLGMSFHAWLRARRLGRALGSLKAGDPVDAAAVDHGFESSSGFREALGRTFGAPAAALREATPLYYRRLSTPLGPMLAMAEDKGLVLLEFLDRPALTAELEELKVRYGYAAAPGSHAHLDQVETELADYFAGRRQRFEVPLAPPGKPFERSVWHRLLGIPYAETLSYGQLAREVGKPGAARIAGWACGRNRIAIVIPCHRVVAADGALTGYGGGKARKAFLLRLERDAASAARTHVDSH
ncbi:MAG TPA: methylated-DNA--[protein]-cysteine S-methyltransferase [Xanthomonadaceae bacterium]|nr:methylated-DNA--[protein]-cysteine S-methyltransferase [Xanthomonadaceae bacterium]